MTDNTLKIVALPDIHSQTGELNHMADILSGADVVLLPGDLTNGRLARAKQVIQTVRRFNLNILTIPGNMDTNEIADYLASEGINIHRTHRLIDGVAFVGVGGALPFAGAFVYSDAQLGGLLQEAAAGVPADAPLVLVCHQPPLNTVTDRLPVGRHVGSQSVREFIETHQPLICFTGHIHEGCGVDRIGQTQVINPGPIWRTSSYAYAEIAAGKPPVVEVRHL